MIKFTVEILNGGWKVYIISHEQFHKSSTRCDNNKKQFSLDFLCVNFS